MLTCCKYAQSAGQTASSTREMELSTCAQTIRLSWYPHYNLFEAGVPCQALCTLSVGSFLTQEKQYAEVVTESNCSVAHTTYSWNSWNMECQKQQLKLQSHMEIVYTKAVCRNWSCIGKNEDKAEVFEKLSLSTTLLMHFLVLLK